MHILIGSLIVLLVVVAADGSRHRTWAQNRPPMSRVAVQGLELEYEIRGSGEPVVLVHAGIFADWFKPILDEPALTDRYRVVSYHRVGYAASGRVTGAVSIADQAAHLRGLLRQLGIARAHLVGHSSGGNIILELARQAPDLVASLVLMEPALPVAAGSERMLATRAAMAPVFEAYRAGDKARAIDGFMRGVSGPGYRATLDRVLPGAFEQGVRDADTFFGQELPALQQWAFTREQAAGVAAPALSILGARSAQLSPIWTERHDMVLKWLPRAEGVVLPEATHLLHVEHPRTVAEALARFFSHHPVTTR
jgi:pimeloyl-ACP methyl ester carboxylesterase